MMEFLRALSRWERRIPGKRVGAVVVMLQISADGVLGTLPNISHSDVFR